MFNQIISIVMSIIMSISNFMFSGEIFSSIKDLFTDDEVTLSTIKEEYYYGDNGVLYSRFVDEDGNETELDVPDKPSKTDTRVQEDLVIPSSYDARNDNLVTVAKSQGSTGCCWAFSTCSMLESNLIKNGYASNSDINISEAHLSWFANKSHVTNSSDYVGYDGLDIASPFNLGGSWLIASFALSTWSGAAMDSQYPFYSYDTTKMEFPDSDRYASSYHLTSAVDLSDTSRDDIKQAVINNGSICTSMYYVSSYLKNSANGYCYYQSAETGTNHAVTIVGWDDNFPASNFITAPPSNGAWLVKNSWGSTWGNNGYFWISYNDASVTSFGVLTAVPAENDYTHNYQYDGFGSFYSLSYGETQVYGTNVFTSTGDQIVKGGGFYTSTDNVTCTVSLYTGLSSAENPNSGTLKESKTLYCNYSGYHTFALDGAYYIDDGEIFSIRVEYSVDSGTAYLPVEGAERALYSDGTKCYYDSLPNQSYFSYDASSWDDSNSYGYNNIPIKAFTIDQPSKFMPVENAAISLENDNLIVGIYPNSMTVSELLSMFENSEHITTEHDKLYTGKILNYVDNSNSVKESATVVVFGDVDCDGISDGNDAFFVTMIIYGMLNSSNLSPASMRSADYNNDGVVNQDDYTLVFNNGLTA